MTTLAELVVQAPDPTHGRPIQASYGVGQWRLCVQLADRSAGASIEWHDMSDHLSEMRWSRGADQPWGKYRGTKGASLLFWGSGDQFSPTNEDTSATFGVHVPLRCGQLIRACVFRVVDEETDLTLHLFTNRVRRWRNASKALGNVRFHPVESIDLLGSLNNRPVGANLEEGWKPRLVDLLVDAPWQYGYDIYGAETVDGTPTLLLPDRDEQASALQEFDASTTPAALVWRTRPNGKLVVHPAPWSTFHADIFGGAGTIVGTPWVNPLDTYYPAGRVVFSYDPVEAEAQVGFWPEAEGTSFNVESDLEAVANELAVTYPGGSFYYDDAVSAGLFDPRPLPGETWLAQNDDLVEEIVDNRANSHFVATPLRFGLDLPGAFPALAVLDHLDPLTVIHTTKLGRDITTVEGLLRAIDHHVKARRNGFISWKASIQADIQTSSESAALNPVEDLAVDDLEDGFVSWTWTNPSQTITPTETHVRIPEVSPFWIPIAYAGVGPGGFAWLGLDPDETYQFDVRLVRVVSDLVTHISPVRSIVFSTPAAEAPDPGGDGVIVIPPGDPDPDCILEWKLESTEDGSSWTIEDSGDEDDFVTDPDTGVITLDLSAFSYVTGKLYRLCTRDVCGGVPGSWVCSEPFQPDCAAPAALGTAPYDDADLLVYVPKICESQVFEAVSDTAGAIGYAAGPFTLDDDGNYVLTSAAEGLVAYGAADQLVGAGSGPLTLSARLPRLGTQPDGTVRMWKLAGLELQAVADGAGWSLAGKIYNAGGGSITIADGVERDLEEQQYAAITHNPATGDLKLYFNATLIDSIDTVDNDRAAGLPIWEVGLPDDSEITDCAAWSRVLSAGELPGHVPTPPSGGIITTIGLYTIHTFHTAGTFDPGSEVPLAIEYLIVGAGAGGGAGARGGGGGGGEVLIGSTTVSTPQAITVGTKGIGSSGPSVAATNGGDSTALGLTAKGGGAGGHAPTSATAQPGAAGGNGGGGNGGSASDTAGGTGDQFNGGLGKANAAGASRAGGGGGGAGGVGEAGGTDGTGQGGDGGPGVTWSINGNVYGGGGGGSGGVGQGAGGNGDLSGAGNGGATDGADASIANRGSGGGGGNATGGDGADGIVSIAYLTP